MRNKVKKVVCEMMSGDGDLLCENCIDLYKDECNKYTTKLLALLKEKK